jgi:CheY-like chemotaxis protein
MREPVAREDVERLLPDLRRFAKMMCGEGATADRCVGAALKRLLRGDDPLGAGPPHQRLFAALVRELPAGGPHPDGAGFRHVLEARIAALPDASRRLLLLTELIGLDLDAAAAALGLATVDAARLRAAARVELVAQPSSRVLIIEDDAVTAISLADILEELTHDVVGIVGTRAQAESAARSQHPGLVLADLELADGVSGLRAAAAIRRASEVPVVFVTGRPERLPATAPRLSLVVKPFEPEMIALATAHALATAKGRRLG